ncbi:MAG: hypothetical protein ABL950_01500 [Nitrospira sp.]
MDAPTCKKKAALMPPDLHSLLIDPVECRGVTLSRCPVPSHGKGQGDRNRSLQTRRGHRAWLLKCWAGCDLAEVCQAMGLSVSDLFDDARHSRGPRSIPKPPCRPDRRHIAFQLDLHGIALQERAERTLVAAGGLETSHWSDEDFDRALKVLGRAFDDLRHVETLFAVADSQREKAFREGR